MLTRSDDLSREDRFLRTNNRLTLGYAAAFALWQLLDIGRSTVDGTARRALIVASLVAWAAWSTLLVITMLRARTARADPLLHAALTDERVSQVRLRAFRSGFIATMGAALLLTFTDGLLSVANAMKLLIVVSVTSGMIAFVVHDRE
jgi:hypothetical protein